MYLLTAQKLLYFSAFQYDVPAPEPSYGPVPEPSYGPAPEPSYASASYGRAPEPSYGTAPKPSYAPAPEPSYAPAPEPSYAPASEPSYAPVLQPSSYTPAPEPSYGPSSKPGPPQLARPPRPRHCRILQNRNRGSISLLQHWSWRLCPPEERFHNPALTIFRSGPIAASKPKPNMRPGLFCTFWGQQNPYTGSGHLYGDLLSSDDYSQIFGPSASPIGNGVWYQAGTYNPRK